MDHLSVHLMGSNAPNYVDIPAVILHWMDEWMDGYKMTTMDENPFKLKKILAYVRQKKKKSRNDEWLKTDRRYYKMLLFMTKLK